MELRGVLDHLQIVLAGDRQHLVEIAGTAVDVDWHDRPGP